jgi:hypothetical protein
VLTRPLRLLVVHRGLLHRRDDTIEVEQHLVGIVEAGRARVDVMASDGHSLLRPVVREDGVVYAHEGRFRPWSGRGFDVAYVHMPVPLVHLVVAACLRLTGTKVVFAPMAMLEDGYARSGWFRPLSRPAVLAKVAAVRVLRVLWRSVADRFVCLSQEEVELTSLDRRRCLLVPWAAPRTALGRAATAPRGEPSEGADPTTSRASADRPAVFISRLDVHRKGIDRLCRWLLQYESSLPRPAVVLFTPPHPAPPAELVEAIDRGVLVWDVDTMGSDLAEPLRESRGSILLSRWEAQARALRESLLLGVPVLTTHPNHLYELAEVTDGIEVVDGDDPASIQVAFEHLGKLAVDVEVVARVFDRRRIGAFLLDAFEGLAMAAVAGRDDGYREVAAAVESTDRFEEMPAASIEEVRCALEA